MLLSCKVRPAGEHLSVLIVKTRHCWLAVCADNDYWKSCSSMWPDATDT